eukprot:201178-Lingulodinium_polyedra.AAC.1
MLAARWCSNQQTNSRAFFARRSWLTTRPSVASMPGAKPAKVTSKPAQANWAGSLNTEATWAKVTCHFPWACCRYQASTSEGLRTSAVLSEWLAWRGLRTTTRSLVRVWTCCLLRMAEATKRLFLHLALSAFKSSSSAFIMPAPGAALAGWAE